MTTEWLDYQCAWTSNCVAKHLGMWLIEEGEFRRGLSLIQENLWDVSAAARAQDRVDERLEALKAAAAKAQGQDTPPGPPYFVDNTGLAVIQVVGQMMKGSSKYGGANTLDIRRQLRMAARDPEVNGIMLLIDSPGGTVAGTEELAADVAAANLQKPVFAHADDFLASAAYWVASQARRITALPSSHIGSIGTMVALQDYSAALEKKGIKVHVISTGPLKGAGADGKITPEIVDYVQEQVDAINEHFLNAVSTGRNAPMSQVQKWATGGMWIAGAAEGLGLIDGVMLFDQALLEARAAIAEPAEEPAARRGRRAVAIASTEAQPQAADLPPKVAHSQALMERLKRAEERVK